MSDKVHQYETAFLKITAGLLVIFFGALMYSAFVMGIGVEGENGHVDPNAVGQTPPFDEPGVHQTGPNTYDVVVIGQAWQFRPAEIHVPRGAELHFIATSQDVIHGFNLEGTSVNMMLIPGQISEMDYRFDEPGEHLLICHEYCGLGHHTMAGKVVVE